MKGIVLEEFMFCGKGGNKYFSKDEPAIIDKSTQNEQKGVQIDRLTGFHKDA